MLSCSDMSDSSVTPWAVAHHIRWNFPGRHIRVGSHYFPGDLPDPGTEAGSPASQADSLPSEPPGTTTLTHM